jgi:excisionase family DNA binding protein
MPRNNNDFHGSISFHTSGTLAKELGVHKNTVKRAAAKGIIKSTKTFGGHNRFTLEEADRIKKMIAGE